MPNTDLSSLKRLLALEEASLASHEHYTEGSSSDQGGTYVPEMVSLRSPTTRTLMMILENKSAHSWISTHFEAAKKEEASIQEVTTLAEALKDEPLGLSFAKNLKVAFDRVAAVAAASPSAAAAESEESRWMLDGERRSLDSTSSQRTTAAAPLQVSGLPPTHCVVGYATNADGRIATIAADAASLNSGNERDQVDDETSRSSSVDRDVAIVSQIGFRCTRDDAITALQSAPSNTPREDQAAANKFMSIPVDPSTRSRTGSATLVKDCLGNDIPCEGPNKSRSADTKKTKSMAELLAEQRVMEAHRKTSHEDYKGMLKEFTRWQQERAIVFDLAVEPLPSPA